jgi:beta-glucanase (GH16 family)
VKLKHAAKGGEIEMGTVTRLGLSTQAMPPQANVKPRRRTLSRLKLSAGWLVLLLSTALLNWRCGGSASNNSQGPMPTGIPGTWHVIFDDEFSGNTLNTNNWTPLWVGCQSGGLSQPVTSFDLEAYDPAQVSVNHGLSLTLINSPATVCGTTYQYRSGMIQSDGKFQFTYGALEAKIYLPSDGTGIIANWPAWWTDGQNWPTDGENDVMEGLGGQACFHFHSSTEINGIGNCVSGDYTGWHTYGADWENGVVNYYYDGVLVGSVNQGITGAPMYLILCYQTSNPGVGGPIVAPATMQVSYVRVWQH